MSRWLPAFLLAFLAAASIPAQVNGLERELMALAGPAGEGRRRAQRRLVEGLEARQVGPFLVALAAAPPEARLRGLAVLSARQDLFTPVARLLLRPREGVPRALVRQAVGSLARAALELPGVEEPADFRPLPARLVRFDGRPRSVRARLGLLLRGVDFDLPLLLWPGGAEESWDPGGPWGGDLRLLLAPGRSRSWLGGGRAVMTAQALLVVRPGTDPAPDPAVLVPELVVALGGESTPVARDGALSLGLLPCPPLGGFLLAEAAGSAPGSPLRLGLSVFAARNGYIPPRAGQARPLILAELAGAEGENLAWAATALASFPAGWGGELAVLGEKLAETQRWRVLLPALRSPFPGLAPWVEKRLALADPGPREAALLLRAAAFLGLVPSPRQVLRLSGRAGPGCGEWGARLLLPLGPERTAPLVRALVHPRAGRVETAAFALARTPGQARRALLDRLEEEPGPARLDLFLQALEAASRQGEEGLAGELLERFDGREGRRRLVPAIAFCRVLCTGPYMGDCRPGPLKHGKPVQTWRLWDQVGERLGTLTRVLQSALLDPDEPLGDEAARSLGRLLGLWQVFSLNRTLTVAAGKVKPERLTLLLREAVALSPMSRTTLRFFLGRAPAPGPFHRIPLGLEPPRGGALDLAALDPLTWALTFPLEAGKSSPGQAGE